MKEKKYRELCLLPENGCENFDLYTHRSEMISNGFERIVFGKRGPYIEFNKYQIDEKKLYVPKEQLYRFSDPRVYYIEFRTTDESNTKVYYQLRTVAYADYKIGYFYISPFHLQKSNQDPCMKSLDINLEIAETFFQFDNKQL